MVRVGVIGVGNIGKHHVRIYANSKNCRLVAISDLNEGTGKSIAHAHDAAFYKDYRQLLDLDVVDAVSICVPTVLHSRIATDALHAGKHILIEKPISSTLEEAYAITKLAKQKNLKLLVGHIERYNPAVQKLKSIIDEGRLGRITSLLARRVGLCPPQIKDVDVIIDLAVHDIDIFNYLINFEPTEIFSGSGRAILDNRNDYADIFLKYGSTNAFIEVNWITPIKIRLLNVTGSDGYAELNYITQELTLYGANYEKLYDEFGEFILKFGNPQCINIDIKKTEPLKTELEHFLNCITTSQEPIVTGDAAAKALSIALKITESLKKI